MLSESDMILTHMFTFLLVCVTADCLVARPTRTSSTTTWANVLPIPDTKQKQRRSDQRGNNIDAKRVATQRAASIAGRTPHEYFKHDEEAVSTNTRLQEFIKSLRANEVSQRAVVKSYTNQTDEPSINKSDLIAKMQPQGPTDIRTIRTSKNTSKLREVTADFNTTQPSRQISRDHTQDTDKRVAGLDMNTTGDHLEISGTVDGHGASLWVQGRQVYSVRDQIRKWAGELRRYHAGVHVVVLHATTGHVLASQLFLTWQPAAHKMLADMLATLQPDRIIVCIGAPDFYGWLLREGTLALHKLGARLGLQAVKGEAWVMAGYTPHTPLYEVLITAKNASATDASPLAFSVTLPRRPGRKCPWQGRSGMAERAEFCERYEGYGQFCDCHQPLHLTPTTAPDLEMEEVIPVALVTARRLPMVARQVQQLWQSPGGAKTPLVMMVDGYNTQAVMLANILNITIAIHNNSAPVGTKHRVNQHIKFSLSTIFALFPHVDKAIILEDDLSLAPDFISYFQQTSILMSVDKTILCVNAYNYNSFPHTASDPSRIYRVQSYPYYGWMTSRAHATRLLSNWAPLDVNADWDLYLRKFHIDDQHEVIIPEVPRTRHHGGAGVHVSGLVQETTYSQRPLNTHPTPIITLRRQWHLAYTIDLMQTLLEAQVVKVTRHPCIESPIPKYQRNTTHVIYIAVGGENDKKHAYQVLGKCLGFYHQGMFEHYRGTYSFKFYETPVILVSCYSSVYCDDRRVREDVIYRPTAGDVTYAKKHPWRHTNETSTILWRVTPSSVWEEVNLLNVAGIEVVLKE